MNISKINQSIIVFLTTIVLSTAMAAVSQASELIVTSTDDMSDGACTVSHCNLREAISAANQDPDLNLIRFQINASDPQYPCGPKNKTQNVCIVSLQSPLPKIDGGPVDINGSIKEHRANIPGSPKKRPGVRIDGMSAGYTIGLDIRGPITAGSTIRGLLFNNFKTDPIFMDGVNANYYGSNPAYLNQGVAINAVNTDRLTIAGVYIGTTLDGLDAEGTVAKGIHVRDGSDEATIGGPTANDRNVILGLNYFSPTDSNSAIQISVTGLEGANTLNDLTIQRNFIGLNAKGQAPAAAVNFINSWYTGIKGPEVLGQYINGYCGNGCEMRHHEIIKNQIANTFFAIAPLVETSDFSNVTIDDLSYQKNKITDGNIGFLVFGQLSNLFINQNTITNLFDSVFLSLPYNNGESGIENIIMYKNTLKNVVYGNMQGFILVLLTGHKMLIMDNKVKTTGGGGVLLGDADFYSSLSTDVHDVSLVGNTYKNLMLFLPHEFPFGYGRTPNDLLDGDINNGGTGVNNLQNYPLLSSAKAIDSNTLQVKGKLYSEPNTKYRLEFFTSKRAIYIPDTPVLTDETGANILKTADLYAEAQKQIGAITVETDADGIAVFKSRLKVKRLPPCDIYVITPNPASGSSTFEVGGTASTCVNATATKITGPKCDTTVELRSQLQCLLERYGDTSEFGPAINIK